LKSEQKKGVLFKMNITFTYPQYLLLLLIVPIIILIHFVSIKSKGVKTIKFANFEAIAKIKGIDFYSKNLGLLFLSILLCLCLILAVSGAIVHMTLPTSMTSFVIAIDTSPSMDAADLFPTRLDAAKEAALKFVKSSGTGTKIGIVSFSGNAFIEQTVTDDKSALTAAIDKIKLGSVSGTDLEDAVGTATNLLLNEKYKSLLLISDGQINTGSIDNAISYANKYDLMINTIAMGTNEGGKTNYGISKIDEDSLKALAFNTNGKYFLAKDNNGLMQFFGEIANLGKSNVGINLEPYLIIAAMVIFLIIFLMINMRHRMFI